MTDKILNKKNELLQWLLSLEDESVINQLVEFQKENFLETTVSEPQAEYEVVDDFEEKFAKGFTLEESKARTKKFIESLPWKK